ncbi:MAG: amino-acid N-acetyltransferase, partial [Gammaproteobacteria bacterium]|nr:amino-acid N-acetyltransferase [Gammaproteobacteria bacterium]
MTKEFVNWFRSATPYINAHKGRTFVIQFGGDTVAADNFPHLIHDIALLNSLGIRLVLVHGTRPQIEQRISTIGHKASFHQDLRITDDTTLVIAKEAAGTSRVEIEALLSMGLANSPMSGARIRVASGNFITARPLGVRDGIDFCHTGEVRRVDCSGIERQLSQENVVLISPLGYSPTGEVFSLRAEDVATAVAVELQATKLLFIGETPTVYDLAGDLIRQATLKQAHRLLHQILDSDPKPENSTINHLRGAIHACSNGVNRTHLLDSQMDGALLLELFTRDGVGCMVCADFYENIHRAGIENVRGILELIEPLEEEGVLVRRPREKLEQEIGYFTVVERDGATTACGALYPISKPEDMELAC